MYTNGLQNYGQISNQWGQNRTHDLESSMGANRACYRPYPGIGNNNGGICGPNITPQQPDIGQLINSIVEQMTQAFTAMLQQMMTMMQGGAGMVGGPATAQTPGATDGATATGASDTAQGAQATTESDKPGMMEQISDIISNVFDFFSGKKKAGKKANNMLDKIFDWAGGALGKDSWIGKGVDFLSGLFKTA